MPTYEYACPSGHRFERFVRKISDADPSPACPECGKIASRLISGAGLVFKGSGFYITDYGKDGKKSQSAPAPKSDSAKSDAPAAAPKSEGASKSDSASKSESTKPKGGE